MWCAMSEYDDNTNSKEDYVHIRLSGVAFHVLCVGLGFARRHWSRTSHRSVFSTHTQFPSFLLEVVVRLYLVIVNSDCSHNYCMLHNEKTGSLRCCPFTPRRLEKTAVSCKRSSCNKINCVLEGHLLRFSPKYC